MRQRSTRLEALESRQLLSAVYPTPWEQYLVELNNWARANPAAAAALYGVAYDEGPPASPITGDPKQPLAINPFLVDSSRSYAQYFFDTGAAFSHTADGHTWDQRMAAAGYIFGSPSGSTESAQLHMGGSGSDLTLATYNDFRNYYTDQSVDGRWHRLNMMNASMKEVGAGVLNGTYQSWPSFITVMDFGFSGTGSFLTGVAYTDSSGDNFYTPGEQMGGVTVLAVRNSDGAVFSTTTWSSGGYSLALPDGTYTVWGSGGTLGSGWIKYDSVTINGLNVKRDFRPDYAHTQAGPNDPQPPPPPPEAFATLSNGILTIVGTDGDDDFKLAISAGTGQLKVVRNGVVEVFTTANVLKIVLSAGSGNDTISLSAGIIGATLDGGLGDDTITGGAGADCVLGGAGADSIKAGAGNDTVIASDGNDIIYGNDGNDSIDGGSGRDRAWGGAGNDIIKGGDHNDSLYGEAGDDSIWGNNQDDLLDGGLGSDFLTGGHGTDTADYSTRTAALYLEITNKYSDRYGRSGQSGERDNILDDVENLTGGSGSDRLIGSVLSNVIKGNAGNDTIYGMGGVDTLLGGAGNDRFFSADSNQDVIDGGAGDDKVSGDLAELLTGVEARSH